MKKPENVENPRLQRLINELWTTDIRAIGDGSTADAIRYERSTGKFIVKGRDHSQKGKDYITALGNWLRSKTSPKPESDKKIARAIIDDLRDALKTKRENGK